ncbi:hypothetical protein V8C86DRAFT_3023736 [Haematococcus lacustris]
MTWLLPACADNGSKVRSLALTCAHVRSRALQAMQFSTRLPMTSRTRPCIATTTVRPQFPQPRLSYFAVKAHRNEEPDPSVTVESLAINVLVAIISVGLSVLARPYFDLPQDVASVKRTIELAELSLSNQIKALDVKIDKKFDTLHADARYARLHKELSDIESGRADLAVAELNLSHQIRALDAKIDTLRTKFDTLDARLARLHKDLSDMKERQPRAKEQGQS